MNKYKTTSVIECYLDAQIEELVVPKRVSRISAEAFYGCANLKTVAFEEGSGNVEIGTDAFNSCTALTTLSLTGVGEIGTGAFEDCKKLTEVHLPKSVNFIGTSAFQGCTSLKSVTFESGGYLSVIDCYTFGGCISLASITLPASIGHIGVNAFEGCTSLKKIIFEKGSSCRLPDKISGIEAEYER